MVKLNGSIFGYKYFGNGEINFEDCAISAENKIEFSFTSNDDILALQIAVEYIRDTNPDSTIEVEFRYLPYSAMDRKMGNQLFTLKYLANIINKLEVDTISVFDAHNMEVLSKLIPGVEYSSISRYTNFVIKAFKPDFIYFPDKGAYKKYPSMISTHGIPTGYGNKVRDINDKGKIVEYNVVTDGFNFEGKRVLIIDDICSRGGTFIHAATELKKLGASEVGLYVSHCEEGILSSGLLERDSIIDKIYTTSSENKFIDVMFRMKNDIDDKKITIL